MGGGVGEDGQCMMGAKWLLLHFVCLKFSIKNF